MNNQLCRDFVRELGGMPCHKLKSHTFVTASKFLVLSSDWMFTIFFCTVVWKYWKTMNYSSKKMNQDNKRTSKKPRNNYKFALKMINDPRLPYSIFQDFLKNTKQIICYSLALQRNVISCKLQLIIRSLPARKGHQCRSPHLRPCWWWCSYCVISRFPQDMGIEEKNIFNCPGNHTVRFLSITSSHTYI
jgi:hypothetical protein